MDTTVFYYGVCTFRILYGFSKGHPVYKNRTFRTRNFHSGDLASQALRGFIDEILPLFRAEIVDYAVYSNFGPVPPLDPTSSPCYSCTAPAECCPFR